MPHRTVFQIGKNHAHPFTVFLGGLVIGTIVTGTIAWATAIKDDIGDQGTASSVTTGKSGKTKNTASPTPTIQPTATPATSF